MASKYQFISALSEQAAKDVAGSPKRWMGYLDTASRLYRYPFNEQLLIHAQRPDATACASICKRQVLSSKKWQLISSIFWQLSTSILYTPTDCSVGIFLLKRKFHFFHSL